MSVSLPHRQLRTMRCAPCRRGTGPAPERHQSIPQSASHKRATLLRLLTIRTFKPASKHDAPTVPSLWYIGVAKRGKAAAKLLLNTLLHAMADAATAVVVRKYQWVRVGSRTAIILTSIRVGRECEDGDEHLCTEEMCGLPSAPCLHDVKCKQRLTRTTPIPNGIPEMMGAIQCT